MPSGIVEVQNRILGGHSPKSSSALWHVQINNCMLFFQFSLIFLTMPRSTPMLVLVMKCLHLPPEGIQQSAISVRVDLTRATVNRIPRHMLELSCQASPRGGCGDDRMIRQDRLQVLGPWRRRWVICMDTKWAQRWQNLTMAHWQHVIYLSVCLSVRTSVRPSVRPSVHPSIPLMTNGTLYLITQDSSC